MSKKKTKAKHKDNIKVKITHAKGRPMLQWVGKRPLASVIAFPAQNIETFNTANKSDIETNKLFLVLCRKLSPVLRMVNPKSHPPFAR